VGEEHGGKKTGNICKVRERGVLRGKKRTGKSAAHQGRTREEGQRRV